METLIVERQDGVVTVTMNRPERKNAANGKMLTELRATFEEVEDNPDDRVMVLTGAGGAFCSGADLSDPNGPATDPSRSGLARMRRLGDVALALHHVSKPAIAKVDGVAVGAGLSLALGCDLIVCSDRARLSMIFAKRGLALDNGASWLLPRLVGLKHAFNDLNFVTQVLAKLGFEFRIHVGLEDLSFPMLCVGASGLMNAVGNLLLQTTNGNTAHGKVTYFRRYDLQVETAPNVFRDVHLHQGTVINPRGATIVSAASPARSSSPTIGSRRRSRATKQSSASCTTRSPVMPVTSR